jgi:hypothetical protein
MSAAKDGSQAAADHIDEGDVEYGIFSAMAWAWTLDGIVEEMARLPSMGRKEIAFVRSNSNLWPQRSKRRSGV